MNKLLPEGNERFFPHKLPSINRAYNSANDVRIHRGLTS